MSWVGRGEVYSLHLCTEFIATPFAPSGLKAPPGFTALTTPHYKFTSAAVERKAEKRLSSHRASLQHVNHKVGGKVVHKFKKFMMRKRTINLHFMLLWIALLNDDVSCFIKLNSRWNVSDMNLRLFSAEKRPKNIKQLLSIKVNWAIVRHMCLAALANAAAISNEGQIPSNDLISHPQTKVDIYRPMNFKHSLPTPPQLP